MRPRLPNQIFRTIVGNPFSAVYLVIAFAGIGLTWFDATFVEHPPEDGASMVGVLPIFWTAPTSLLLSSLTDAMGMAGRPGPACLMLSLAALINATVIGLIVRLAQGPRAGAATPNYS
ncbi:SCO4225 family membrane protein [Streptomyces nigrescens]|uniref:SCO4225 family membrane protein n=1 Tax=Streptomyces nigrescens TaxID=1920 RepID=UPI00348864A6